MPALAYTPVFLFISAVYSYQFLYLCRAYGPGKRRVVFFLFLAAMAFFYLLRRYPGDDPLLSLYVQAGFLFMPYAFAFTGIVLAADLARLAGRALRRSKDSAFMRLTSPPRVVRLAAPLALAVALFGFWSACNITPTHLTIATDKLPAGCNTVRLAIVSDVHISHLAGPAFVKRVVDVVNKASPDIFISLGDLTDKNIAAGSEEAALLRAIKTTYGSFGVLGNHEFYYDYANMLAFYKEAGITLLRDEALTVGPIRLLGSDDYEGVKRGHIKQIRRLQTLRQNASTTLYSISLNHKPHVPRAAVGLFDLQLSGHLHGGQAWPVSLYIKRFRPYTAWRQAKLQRDGKESELFVTYGAGFNGPPFRLFVPAEVVILDIVKKEKQD